MGTVTKTIGSAGGRDYSTLQAWEDALPANLVTDGNSQVGNCYNDSEFTSGSAVLLTISGETTDATHTITLQCASGQGFADNANSQTNALKYNASNGVGIRTTGAYLNTIAVGSSNVFLSGLQIYKNSSGVAATLNVTGQAVASGCIVVGDNPSSTGIVYFNTSSVSKLLNSLLVCNTSSAQPGLFLNGNSHVVVNSTVVRPSDKTAGSSAIGAQYATHTVKNCAGFGFSNFVNNNARFAGSNNCSDQTIGFGTSNQASKTYANQFVGTTSSAQDFRLKSGADCFDNGVTDTTDIPAAIDIVNTTRPQSSAWDIGCWELVVSSSGFYYVPQLAGSLAQMGGGMG